MQKSLSEIIPDPHAKIAIGRRRAGSISSNLVQFKLRVFFFLEYNSDGGSDTEEDDDVDDEDDGGSLHNSMANDHILWQSERTLNGQLS